MSQLLFLVESDERELIRAWREGHPVACRNGSFSYVFTPNGIFTGLKVVCRPCGKFLDLTDKRIEKA